MNTACLGPTCVPILQIHPSRHCNLSCRHCYSSSAPEARGGLDPARVVALIQDAAAEGYRALSISGGEPFLYAGLAETLRAARECGMQTLVATNGYYLDSNKYRKCRSDIDVIALSIDGLAEEHNAMRGRPDAFAALMRAAAILRADGKPFAFIHTVHNRNWHEVDQIADIAESAGAQSLQLHPLEVAGRASQTMQKHGLSRANARRLFLAGY